MKTKELSQHSHGRAYGHEAGMGKSRFGELAYRWTAARRLTELLPPRRIIGHWSLTVDEILHLMTLAEKQRDLTAHLAALPNSQQRLAWLIDQARARPLMPAELRTEENRVPGCLSRLWLVSEFSEGRCFFKAESDSLVVKSIAGMLCDFYSGASPDEILSRDPAFLGELDVDQHITPNRRNALSHVWQRIRSFAQDHSIQ